MSQSQVNQPTSRNAFGHGKNDPRISIEVTHNKKKLPHANHLSLSQHSLEQPIRKQELISILLRALIPTNHKKMNYPPCPVGRVTLIPLPNQQYSLIPGVTNEGAARGAPHGLTTPTPAWPPEI